MSKEVAEEYASSLADLTVNSKPLINMLTILAEENIDHAGVIVETVEKHLEKVHPDIKLPVLYLVDSIIKNVGGMYTTKFSQSIVNMFTRTFKQVDEKIRSQMFKLRETWHDVFPATKLYQLDVKVNLIDPAWPIQAQPQQANIHVNPNFLKKQSVSATTSNNVTATPTPAPAVEDDEKMRSILAKKEQELLMLQRKKVEMELEQMRRQVEIAEKTVTKKVPTITITNNNATPAPPAVVPVQPVVHDAPANIPVKQRLGPPVNKPSGRIAPVSAALVAARRDPRLARRAPVAVVAPAAPIAPNVFDIKPLDHVTKRKNVITIDVRPDAAPPARRKDPRLDKRDQRRPRRPDERRRAPPDPAPVAPPPPPAPSGPPQDTERVATPAYADKLPDPKKIGKMPPIPKLNRAEKRDAAEPAPPKRKREAVRAERRKRREDETARETERPVADEPTPPVASPDKKSRREAKEARERAAASERAAAPESEPKRPEPELITFKELRNYHKERYMRRNREKSESPEVAEERASEPPNVPEVITETKDVDLRVLHPVVSESKASPIAQKRSSTEAVEIKAKKNKIDKFDVLFGNEDVDLRQLPQVDEVSAPPPPSITSSPKSDKKINDKKFDDEIEDVPMTSPTGSPKRDWHEVKKREDKKTPSKLDLVRAKLAEATKGKDKDRLGRPLLFSKSPSVERERRRTISGDDIDLRVEDQEDFDENKKSISIIMSQAKEHLNDGQLDKNQYNTLMYQVLQLNERLKLKEAKQRESLEISKRKLNNAIHEENHKVTSPKSSPSDRNKFGDIDERITPSVFMDTPPDSQGLQDSDMRIVNNDVDGPKQGLLPLPPTMPLYGPYPPIWRGQPRPPRGEEFGSRRFRGPMPPFFRGKFDKRNPRPPFVDPPRLPMPPPLPTPKMGTCQGECPLPPYERSESPPPLGAPGFAIPPTDFKVLEYIDQDPVKTIQIDGIPREIRFYGDLAVIMLDWDDPREIKFLPGLRRVTFDNKDSIVLSFNEGYKQVEIDEQVFDIKFGSPTRELYINGRWYECFFGGQPLGVIIDGKPRLVHLEGPMPQVDIGKVKRTDLVAGKINLIVNATQMYPVYLDSKVQKILVNGQFLTIRFVDSLRTVLINEQPFKVEFGDLPKPIYVGSEKYFIRFSALPRNVKPGYIQIANMEGIGLPLVPPMHIFEMKENNIMETDEEPIQRPVKTPSPEINTESLGLDMLASVMPSSIVPASSSEYSLAEPLFSKPDKIPGLEVPAEEKAPNPILPVLGNINVSDLFAKLVATGIVQVPNDTKTDTKEEEVKQKVEEVKQKPREDRNMIHRVDFMKPETLRVKQPGLVSKLYGGMQCSGCGARFPPEHTVRYSQHLDWHFRQNRRDRDSARRAHSRHWHYDLSDWVQYEEVEDLEEREKSWFETGGAATVAGSGAAAEGEGDPGALGLTGPGGLVGEEAPSAAASAPLAHTCALCGDLFDQFYNEDKEEWHLRNAVKHQDDYYHPICFDDYKASLTKEEPPKEDSGDDVISEQKIEEEAIEIKDVDEPGDQSDNESVVEVVEDKDADPVEIVEEEEEGDEDDVVFKAEPVDEVVVDDDNDTDDETAATRAERDRQAELDFTMIKVKQEPIDPDDEPIITAEEETIPTSVDTTHATVETSIDGNMQLDAANAPATVLPIGGIRINISKSLPTFVSNIQDHDKNMLEDISADDEPLPPGEEPELEYTLKPALEGVQFSRQPPVSKGNELSGLCSIM